MSTETWNTRSTSLTLERQDLIAFDIQLLILKKQ